MFLHWKSVPIKYLKKCIHKINPYELSGLIQVSEETQSLNMINRFNLGFYPYVNKAQWRECMYIDQCLHVNKT